MSAFNRAYEIEDDILDDDELGQQFTLLKDIQLMILLKKISKKQNKSDIN